MDKGRVAAVYSSEKQDMGYGAGTERGTGGDLWSEGFWGGFVSCEGYDYGGMRKGLWARVSRGILCWREKSGSCSR